MTLDPFPHKRREERGSKKEPTVNFSTSLKIQKLINFPRAIYV